MKETTANVTDPVCGMSFKPDKAVAHATYKAREYHFCTEACKKQFDADPERYVEARGGPGPTAGAETSEDWIE